MRRDHYKINPHYRHLGLWSWNTDKMWSKIEVSLDPQECWLWQGAMTPSGAVFGVKKAGHSQMTQVRRLVVMEQEQRDITPYQVTMKCDNQQCVCPDHFELKPSYRWQPQ